MNARTCCLSLLLVVIALPVAAQDPSEDFERALSKLGEVSPDLVKEAGLTTIDSQAMVTAFQLLTAQPSGEFDETTIRQWAKDHNIDELDLVVTVLEWLALDRFSAVAYRPFAALLWEKLQDSEEGVETLPAQPRIFLVMYLGSRGECAAARQAAESITEKLPHNRWWTLATELQTNAECLPLALYAMQRALRLEPDAATAIEYCCSMRNLCQQIGDKPIVQKEFIPVVGEELKRVFTTGAHKDWPRLLSALMWGYQYLDDHTTALEVGEDWLRWAEYWKVSTDERHLSGAEQMIDDSIIAEYGVGEIISRLVQSIREPGSKSEKAKRAQRRFFELARANPEESEIMVGEFKRVWPENLTVSLRAGEQVTRTVTVKGDDLFWVRGADCELPWANAVLGKETVGTRDNSYAMDLTIGPIANAGGYVTEVVIQTNDPRNQTIQVLVLAEVLSPVTARPDSFFFGFLKTGQAKSATVTLTSTVPFEVTDAQADKPELITVEVTRQEDNSYQIKATLKTPDQSGTLEGNIEVQTDLPGQPTVTIPYFVQISAAE